MSSIPSLLLISRTLLAKSVVPAIAPKVTVAAVNRASSLFLSLGRLRSDAGFCTSSSTSSTSMMSSSRMSDGN